MVGSYETCQKISNTRMCANCQHDSILVVRHVSGGPADSQWQVCCPKCGETERFVSPESPSKSWRRDPGSVPVVVANKLQARYGGDPMSEQALTTITKAEMRERIDGARWMHQLTPAQAATLAEVAVRYGYDPLMGEVTVYEGKIYVTLDGALRDAKRVPNFQGIQTVPMSQEEREARGIKQPIAYRAELYRADWRVPAVGIGVADPANPFRNNPVEKQQPHALAEARAIRRAVRLAREAPSGIIREDERAIDTETGEIVTTTAREVPVENPTPAKPPAPAMTERRRKLLARWEAVWAEAQELGIPAEPLAGNADEATIIKRGQELNAAVEARQQQLEAERAAAAEDARQAEVEPDQPTPPEF